MMMPTVMPAAPAMVLPPQGVTTSNYMPVQMYMPPGGHNNGQQTTNSQPAGLVTQAPQNQGANPVLGQQPIQANNQVAQAVHPTMVGAAGQTQQVTEEQTQKLVDLP